MTDWITELTQLGRDNVYVRLCNARMNRLLNDCGWSLLADIRGDDLIRWRQTATATVGHAQETGSNIVSMSARNQHHYLDALRCFCLWAIRRKRMPANPVSDIALVETAGKLRRQRRALAEDELFALLEVVRPRHELAYRIILGTGLRRDDLRQLR